MRLARQGLTLHLLYERGSYSVLYRNVGKQQKHHDLVFLDLVTANGDILAWYVSVSRPTRARPWSAGKTVIESLSLRFFKIAFCIFFVMLGLGGSAF